MDLLFTDDAEGCSLGDVVVADPTRFDHVAHCAGLTGLGVAARLAASQKYRTYIYLFRGDAFRPLAVETYGCLDGPFDDFLRECARRAAASGTTSASSSTLACFFRQRVSVALHRAQAVAVCRHTMLLDIAQAGLPSLSPRDPLHCLDIAHIAGFPGAGCA